MFFLLSGDLCLCPINSFACFKNWLRESPTKWEDYWFHLFGYITLNFGNSSKFEKWYHKENLLELFMADIYVYIYIHIWYEYTYLYSILYKIYICIIYFMDIYRLYRSCFCGSILEKTLSKVDVEVRGQGPYSIPSKSSFPQILLSPVLKMQPI